MGYAIFHLKKIHSLSSLATMGHHNFRTLPSAAPKADMTRTHQNRILVNPFQTDYIALWRDRQYEVNMSGGHCKPRKGAVIAYEMLLTMSKDAVPPDRIDAWAEESTQWLKDTFGAANTLSAVLHMDETTPHIHAVVIPIDERNRLCAFSITGSRGQLREMQTSYAKRMEIFGLERGEEYSRGTLVADDIRQFYGRLEKIMYGEPPERHPDEPVGEYMERVDSYMKTALSKAYDRERKWKRKYAKTDAIHKQIYNEYRDAILLYDSLFRRCYGDKELMHRQFRKLIRFTDQAPLKTLDTSLDFLADKFARNENLECYFQYRDNPDADGREHPPSM